jgi:hypothetical protein
MVLLLLHSLVICSCEKHCFYFQTFEIKFYIYFSSGHRHRTPDDFADELRREKERQKRDKDREKDKSKSRYVTAMMWVFQYDSGICTSHYLQVMNVFLFLRFLSS